MTWPPEQEAYCPVCYRMVAAQDSYTTEIHYRFNLVGNDPRFILCKGRVSMSRFSHGMDNKDIRFLPTEPDTYPEPPPDVEPVRVILKNSAGQTTRTTGYRFSFRRAGGET